MVNKLFRHRTRRYRPRRPRTRRGRRQARRSSRRRRTKNHRRYRGGTDTPSPTASFDPAEFDELELDLPPTQTFDDFPVRDRWYDRLPSSVPVASLPVVTAPVATAPVMPAPVMAAPVMAAPAPVVIAPAPVVAASRTKRNRIRACGQTYCRRPHGHTGSHSKVAERFMAMSPGERSGWLKQGNSRRTKARAEARASSVPYRRSRKADFVRCPTKYCHKAMGHPGEHSLENADTKAEAIRKMVATKAKGAAMVHGRDIGSQTDLAITRRGR